MFLRSILMGLQIAGAAPVAEQSATLEIKVQDVSKKGGDVRLGLYDQSSWSNDKSKPLAGAVVPALSPQTVITLRDLKPGVYGVKLFQDFNRNGEFDFTWLHLPAEKYGFSHDAPAFLQAPGFERTRFTLAPGANTITVHLR